MFFNKLFGDVNIFCIVLSKKGLLYKCFTIFIFMTFTEEDGPLLPLLRSINWGGQIKFHYSCAPMLQPPNISFLKITLTICISSCCQQCNTDSGSCSLYKSGMIVGARRANSSISESSHLLGFSRTTVSRVYPECCDKYKTSSQWQFFGWK
jgi:hypothetical protein